MPAVCFPVMFNRKSRKSILDDLLNIKSYRVKVTVAQDCRLLEQLTKPVFPKKKPRAKNLTQIEEETKEKQPYETIEKGQTR